MRNAVWRAGDTALIVAPSGRAKRWNQLPEFLVVTKPHVQPTRPSGRRSPREIAYHCFPCGLFLCMVTLSALSLVPLVRGALVSLVLLLCSGHLRPMSTLKAVDGQVMLTLASAIGFGASLKASGTASVCTSLTLASHSHRAGRSHRGPYHVCRDAAAARTRSACVFHRPHHRARNQQRCCRYHVSHWRRRR
mmetsp:Transcript_29723/g.64245  ORF Transcript_29723/g.64245 Transcript_29723/m.64245 type:complete len:192 (-) Transcript_29723:981-1556(-)